MENREFSKSIADSRTLKTSGFTGAKPWFTQNANTTKTEHLQLLGGQQSSFLELLGSFWEVENREDLFPILVSEVDGTKRNIE